MVKMSRTTRPATVTQKGMLMAGIVEVHGTRMANIGRTFPVWVTARASEHAGRERGVLVGRLVDNPRRRLAEDGKSVVSRRGRRLTVLASSVRKSRRRLSDNQNVTLG